MLTRTLRMLSGVHAVLEVGTLSLCASTASNSIASGSARLALRASRRCCTASDGDSGVCARGGQLWDWRDWATSLEAEGGLSLRRRAGLWVVAEVCAGAVDYMMAVGWRC